MTFQPPPSEPPGAYPPPPPPPAAGGAFDPKSVNPLDYAIIGAGALAFIFSFISFYTANIDASGSCPPQTTAAISAAEDAAGSASAWHGFFGWFGVLAALVGAGYVAAHLFAPQVKLPVPARLGALAAFAVAALCEILALFITPGSDVDLTEKVGTCTIEGSVGHGFGYWVTLLAALAGLVLSLMRFQATGGQLPGGLQGKVPDLSGYGPQDRPGPGAGQGPTPGPNPGPNPGPRPGYGEQPPPPPPGYGPPQ